MTAVHKANIMKLADGLFLESCREVANKYPSIQYNEMIVDNCSMQLVSKPEQFDVMVRDYSNLYFSVHGDLYFSVHGDCLFFCFSFCPPDGNALSPFSLI